MLGWEHDPPLEATSTSCELRGWSHQALQAASELQFPGAAWLQSGQSAQGWHWHLAMYTQENLGPRVELCQAVVYPVGSPG